MSRGFARDRLWGTLAITATVVGISILHYATSWHSVIFHEILKGLYYVPIVMAAVIYGLRFGLAASTLASILYVPHIALRWHAWPVFEFEQYGDVLLFNLVALVTGVLADRLRAERNRYQRTSVELEAVNRELIARTDERIQADRLVTIGRLASGIAHEVRNPLGALLGSLEILEQAPGLPMRQREFVGVARNQIDRLDRVIEDFLEFARPASAEPRTNDLAELLASAIRLARPNLACQGIEIEMTPPERAALVQVDSQQLVRSVVNLLLDRYAPASEGTVHLSVVATLRTARVLIDVPHVADAGALVEEIFEPFPDRGNGHGLSLAIARRLIENQGGRVRVEADSDSLRYVIDLPLSQGAGESDAVESVRERAGAVTEVSRRVLWTSRRPA